MSSAQDAARLGQWGMAFQARMQHALNNIDPQAPESIEFMGVWKSLNSEFDAFMAHTFFSDPIQLKNMLKMTKNFDAKYDNLPKIKRKKYKKQPEAKVPDVPKHDISHDKENPESAVPVF